MGQLLATMGRCEEAESALKSCVSLDGSHSKDPVNHETSRVSALVTLGKLHADRGRYSDAVRAYKHAVTILPPYYNSRVSLVRSQCFLLRLFSFTSHFEAKTTPSIMRLVRNRQIQSFPPYTIFFVFVPCRQAPYVHAR